MNSRPIVICAVDSNMARSIIGDVDGQVPSDGTIDKFMAYLDGQKWKCLDSINTILVDALWDYWEDFKEKQENEE